MIDLRDEQSTKGFSQMIVDPITAKEYSDRITTRFAHLFDMDYGISVFRGWGPIVEQAVSTIDVITRTHGGSVTIFDIKQKLGELRIYASMEGDPRIWCLCKDIDFQESQDRPLVDGRMPASPHAIGYALQDGETLWRKTDDDVFVPAVEEALRQHAIWSLVCEAITTAKAIAGRTCEFCGEYGEFDASNGYLAVACAKHSGPGRQPRHRGDEFAASFVEPEWSKKRGEANDAEAVASSDVD